jgi:hypothetical protein
MTKIGAITSLERLRSGRWVANQGENPPAPRSKLPGAAMSATVPPETGVHMGNVGYYNRLSWLYGGTGLDAA